MHGILYVIYGLFGWLLLHTFYPLSAMGREYGSDCVNKQIILLNATDTVLSARINSLGIFINTEDTNSREDDRLTETDNDTIECDITDKDMQILPITGLAYFDWDEIKKKERESQGTHRAPEVAAASLSLEPYLNSTVLAIVNASNVSLNILPIDSLRTKINYDEVDEITEWYTCVTIQNRLSYPVLFKSRYTMKNAAKPPLVEYGAKYKFTEQMLNPSAYGTCYYCSSSYSDLRNNTRNILNATVDLFVMEFSSFGRAIGRGFWNRGYRWYPAPQNTMQVLHYTISDETGIVMLNGPV